MPVYVSSQWASKFVFHFNEVGRKYPSFLDAANIASVLLANGFEQCTQPAILYFNFYKFACYSF